MRLSNGEVLLAWPLAQHIITQGWFYNDGSLHRAIDLRITRIRRKIEPTPDKPTVIRTVRGVGYRLGEQP